MTSRTLVPTMAFAVVLLAAAHVIAAPAHEIVPVSGNLYRVQDGTRATVIFVTATGILVADPLTPGTAAWLRDELAARFPGRTVRFMVPTSYGFDRVSGAPAFAGAPFIVHRYFNSERHGAATRLPPALAPLDRNRNGRLEKDEWAGAADDLELPSFDADGDGVVTRGELFGLGVNPTSVFRDRQTLDVGGSSAIVANPVNVSTPYSTVLFFPSERVAFNGGATFTSGAFALRDADPRVVRDWLHGVAALPFEVMIDGRGTSIDRATFDELVSYVDDLSLSVVSAYESGLSVNEAAGLASLEKYRGSPRDTQRVANVAAIYDALTLTRVELQGAAIVRWPSRNEAYCASFSGCESGERVAGGSGAIAITRSRLGAVLEMSFAEQSFAQRQSANLDEAYAQRISRGSLLFRYGARRPIGLSVDLLAGGTLVVADTSGVTRIKGALAPTGGRHAFATSAHALGATAGVNLTFPVTSAISVVVPARVTYLGSPALVEQWPGKVVSEAGVGLSVRVARRVR